MQEVHPTLWRTGGLEALSTSTAFPLNSTATLHPGHLPSASLTHHSLGGFVSAGNASWLAQRSCLSPASCCCRGMRVTELQCFVAGGKA